MQHHCTQHGAVFAHLQESRCIEELQLLDFERQRTLQYYAHVRDVCIKEATERLDKAESLFDSIKAQVSSSSTTDDDSNDNRAGMSTTQLQQLLDDYLQTLAEVVLLQRSSEQHDGWLKKALSAFGRLNR